MAVQEMERRGTGALLRPALAAFAAAIAGGVVWGLIVKWTAYEIGFVAAGIGILAGLAVVAASRGARGLPLQVIAIVAALVGVVVGKYLGYLWFGEENGYTFREMWSWWDALWIGLAVVMAYRIADHESEEPELASTDARE